MRKAIISGTFDPITRGHCDLIRRAAAMFDSVYVVAVNNTEKNCMFTPKERLAMLGAAVSELAKEGISNVITDSYDGLTSDYMHSNSIGFIVRGARNSTDFDYEYSLSEIMKHFDPSFETVILPASPDLSFISSTYVRDLVKYRLPVDGAVPTAVAGIIAEIR